MYKKKVDRLIMDDFVGDVCELPEAGGPGGPG